MVRLPQDINLDLEIAEQMNPEADEWLGKPLKITFDEAGLPMLVEPVEKTQ